MYFLSQCEGVVRDVWKSDPLVVVQEKIQGTTDVYGNWGFRIFLNFEKRDRDGWEGTEISLSKISVNNNN